MALINDVQAICDRVAPLGWRDLLLNVSAGRLAIAQEKPASNRQVLLKGLPTKLTRWPR